MLHFGINVDVDVDVVDLDLPTIFYRQLQFDTKTASFCDEKAMKCK